MEGKVCDILNSQYTSVFSTPLRNKLVEDPINFFKSECFYCIHEQVHICKEDDDINGAFQPISWEIGDIFIDEGTIMRILKTMPQTLAAGIDGIPAILLNKCYDSLAKPVTMLWRTSYESGKDPDRLKTALILPYYKSGAKKSSPSGYRPISLTSQLSKVFEKLLKDVIVNFLEANDLLGQFQFGFRKGRSCLASMLEYYDKIIQSVENGVNVDSIYLDFEKAFDKVDHGLLCHRLKEKRI